MATYNNLEKEFDDSYKKIKMIDYLLKKYFIA
jgi:hypothetical protein